MSSRWYAPSTQLKLTHYSFWVVLVAAMPRRDLRARKSRRELFLPNRTLTPIPSDIFCLGLDRHGDLLFRTRSFVFYVIARKGQEQQVSGARCQVSGVPISGDIFCLGLDSHDKLVFRRELLCFPCDSTVRDGAEIPLPIFDN